MDKKRIYVDMDGVICDYVGKAKQLGYDLDDASHHKGFFLGLHPINGSIHAIKKLSWYFDVYILTAASWSNSIAYSEKIEWIKNYLPDIAKEKRAIFSNDKSLLKGDYLIDDRDVNKQREFEGEWIEFGSKKFPNWEVVVDYIIKKEIGDIQEELVNAVLKWKTWYK